MYLNRDRLVFPRDHGPHDAYRSEWWYYTGNLQSKTGRRFGYELTFFRFALTSQPIAGASNWRSNQVYMAHFALTDVENQRFYADERYARAGNGLAGARKDKLHVWLYDWQARAHDANEKAGITLNAQSDEAAIDLQLTPLKPLVLQGQDGLSQKSAEPGNASYYYSYTRLQTEGRLRIGHENFAVNGASWMDREWSSSALSKEQAGWDWFALQLFDDSEIMFYRLRRKDGKADPHSAGAVFHADHSQTNLSSTDVVIEQLDNWRSPHSGISYPSQWRLSIPSQKLELLITPLMEDQELNITYRYWEGAVSVSGVHQGRPVTGQGYVELAGYR
nr:lipocalin-like domain-containing protein [Methylomarinum sp. Ch1-1]MDP4520833.1 lipocalin-like domain-containing protein [Methylomarinum sp. Ch1-1]